MPGIAGIIATGSSDANVKTLRTMVRRMMHEPSYSSGTYANEHLGLGIGWVCHKGSFSDCMPVWNETKDICLVFSGEDFSDQAEITKLLAHGHQFDGQNAAYLVHLYEEMGIKFLERLNGWFSGLLLDLREERMVLFNDRYAASRIYFHQTEGALFFASEAKALLSVLPHVRQLDLRGLAEFCSCGCPLQNRTLFSGISLLPGASRWTFSRTESPKREVYFRKETWEEQPALRSGSEYYDKLKATFARVLPRYFYGDRQIGLSLTGGLDGRMIMAWAGRPPGTMPCYTFGGPYRDCADVRLARKVAQICRQEHKVIPVGGEFFAQFGALVEQAVYFSDGAMDPSGSVELYVNRIARDIAPIRLTGNLGSEILRAHVAFKPQSLNEAIYTRDLTHLGRAAAERYSTEAEGRRLSFIAFKQVSWHHCSRMSVEQSQLTLRSPFLDNELVSLAYQAPGDLGMSPEPSLRLIADGNPALGRIPTDRGLRYRPIPLVSRMQHLFNEFTFRAEYAFDYGMPQWLAQIDHALSPLRLERLFLGRHKFEHFRTWYGHELAEYLKDVLLDSRTRQRPYLQGACVEDMLSAHLRGIRNYTTEIHKVLSTELIQRQLIERSWGSSERPAVEDCVCEGGLRA